MIFLAFQNVAFDVYDLVTDSDASASVIWKLGLAFREITEKANIIMFVEFVLYSY